MRQPADTSSLRSRDALHRYVAGFVDERSLAARITTVLAAIGEPVVSDLVDDPRFRITVDGDRVGVWLCPPHPGGGASRSVVLKRSLAHCSCAFACYVIAHELAHAYLRNGPWGQIDDPELAADALAASWGFGRPAHR